MGQRVLLIKISSMGDLIHALPALSDAANAVPGIRFDWVADQSFAEIPGWHPAVNRVITSNHRVWKKNLWRSLRHGDLQRFHRDLNTDNYHLVVDCQSSLKSAAVAMLRRIGGKQGEVHGLNKACVREKPAHWFYTQRHFAAKTLHSITRQRSLMAQALGYAVPDTPPDYGLNRGNFANADIDLPERYVFLVHNASWVTKLWPERHWQHLIALAIEAGYSVLLPCGSEAERLRAEHITAPYDKAHSLPRMSLSRLATVMDKAAGAVCCDTGLGHIAAALGIPAVSLYGPTDAKLIGATGQNQLHVIASSENYSCAPCYRGTCKYEGQETSACMQSFAPEAVWDDLENLIEQRRTQSASASAAKKNQQQQTSL